MAPRYPTRKPRDNDYSEVGKAGRRTGLELPEGKRDQDGFEEITALFSSPKKPSPVKINGVTYPAGNEESHNGTIEESEDMVGVDSSGLEPTQLLSTRKSLRGASLPPPRSASPKKTGINGVARRSGAGLDFTPSKAPFVNEEDQENTPTDVQVTPRPNGTVRRFNPESSPLKEWAANNGSPWSIRQKQMRKGAQPSPGQQINKVVDDILEESNNQLEDSLPNGETNLSEAAPVLDTVDVNPMGDDDEEDQDYQLPNVDGSSVSPEEELDDVEDEQVQATLHDGTSLQTPPTKKRGGRPAKRKSDSVIESFAVDGGPTNKKQKTALTAKAKGKQPVYRDESPVVQSIETTPRPVKTNKPNQKSKRVPKTKDPNLPVRTQFSPRREKQIEEAAERIRARPGGPKSLYILRRETPMDENATRTRSGRTSVKPLAYWKNERCVYGEDTGSENLKIGERYPMSSIKEIVRVEEQTIEGTSKAGRKKKSNGRKKAGTRDDYDSTDSSDEDEKVQDDYAEPWESEIGVFSGVVRQWDQEAQEGIEEPLELAIAYAPSSIMTREVKDSTFRYAKVLSTPLIGAGIVELPPGAIKKTKNSAKMHMCFYIVKGRVTADVQGNRFSLGKGGIWQVPRGNQYSITNEFDREAILFFSQGCEPFKEMVEE